ncbi:ABC transporter permease [Arthrobacter sp. SLBN-112]|uniref:ABC transporter permease n=1 Tax=Arthrobacter sp. SLBN-112 TaxID=2768452 RepID=UPI0027B466F1|nr:ABC transporter permease [Arthrobacter sp. SLBN-112]MDQ0799014.1 ribose/xylose/arabinose/galactoside ABC-type transport system permease subunit [Arthrobacter sp. SLBN-112]
MSVSAAVRAVKSAKVPTLIERIQRSVRSGEQPVFLYVAFLVLVLGFSVASPVFFSADNFANIARQTALVSIIAVGMSLVIVTAEIDLSVASNLALSGVVAAIAMREFASSWTVGALAAIACGILIGLINGLLVAKLGIPSFLVTLGMLGVARGIAMMITNTAPVLVSNRDFWTIFGDGSLIGISTPILWTAFVILSGVLILHFSTFGRKVIATGGNALAAKYSGIKVGRIKISVFAITGALAGLAGLILTARGHAARPDVASGLELDVIAAVILGGVSLFGGRGTIFGVVLGSLIIGILNNGLVLMGVSPAVQLTVKGIIIIAAVAFNNKKK